MTDAHPRPALVALGANLPWQGTEPAQTLRLAFDALATAPEISHARLSSLWRSAPERAEGPDFINAVALLQTALAPEGLLALLLRLERAFGRERPTTPNARPGHALSAARTLDLDLIWMQDEARATPELTLPHPRAGARAFVLLPLCELAPQTPLAAPNGRLQAAQTLLRSLPGDRVSSCRLH